MATKPKSWSSEERERYAEVVATLAMTKALLADILVEGSASVGLLRKVVAVEAELGCFLA